VAGAPITIQLIAPFSSFAASFGTDDQLGLKLAFDEVNNEVNGHQISVVTADDQCSPAAAVQQVAKVIDTALVVVGFPCSGNMSATGASLAAAGLPHLFLGYLSDVTETGDQTIFQVPAGDKVLRAGLIAYAKSNLNITKWAVLHDTSGYGAGGAKNFAAAATAAGDTIVTQATYNSGQKDFTGVLLNLDKSGADAIDLIGYDSDLGLIAKQAKQAGIKTQIVGDLDYSTKVFQDAAGDTANNQYFVSSFLPGDTMPAVAPFAAKVQAANGEVADETADGYAAGLVLIQAIKSIQGDVTRANLAAALRQVNISESPIGAISFDASGARTGSNLVVIGRIVNGKPTFIARL
jgi:branched-chain amino acid transport system substrate-binding protein